LGGLGRLGRRRRRGLDASGSDEGDAEDGEAAIHGRLRRLSILGDDNAGIIALAHCVRCHGARMPPSTERTLW
jgi:hypothetical protein